MQLEFNKSRTDWKYERGTEKFCTNIQFGGELKIFGVSHEYFRPISC